MRSKQSRLKKKFLNNLTLQLIYNWLMHHQKQIGGDGIIVEIDEAKFGRRKYNRGRLITGQWLFGGIERGTKKIFILPVVSRKAEVLIPIIKKHIAPGSIIYSDCWKAYEQIDKSTYQHQTVNHSENFVDPHTGVHTQNVERLWRDVRGVVPKYGRREYHFDHYLAEFVFKKMFRMHERIDGFFDIISIMYPINDEYTESVN